MEIVPLSSDFLLIFSPVTQVGSASNSPISGLVPSLFTLPITDGELSSKLTSINVKFKRLEPTTFMIGNSWVTPKVVVSLMYVIEYQDYSGINHFTSGAREFGRGIFTTKIVLI